MAFPYQCLVARTGSTAAPHEWTLFGASGAKLVVQSSTGASSVWPEQDIQARDEQDDESEGPPGKRIKLEQPKEQKSNFASLILSKDGQYLIGVTGEDKCIRVFRIDSQSRLHQLSERCMSRRPSSITLTSDDATILCADKFGDVYALPLLPSPEEESSQPPEVAESETKEKEWVPSATTLTVHSGRNRKTLEDQLKQKAKGPAKSKEPMRFKHDLLLGHVSMLTDLVYAELDSRSYIITADRDEHIRISRGQPQAHIIEGFCFGHSAFINQLCLTPSGRLVSGGGDDHLYVWDWQNYRLVEQLSIQQLAFKSLTGGDFPDISPLVMARKDFTVAVSGIWPGAIQGDADEIVVTCEGVPALFNFRIGAGDDSGMYIPLKGNALDVAMVHVSPERSTLVVSIDNIHKPGPSMEVRDDTVSPLQYFTKQRDDAWREDASLQAGLSWFEHQGSGLPAQRVIDGTATDDMAGNGTAHAKSVRDILYSVENLRKRPGAED